MGRRHSRGSPRGQSPGAGRASNPAQRWQKAVAAFQAGDAVGARKALKPLLDHPAADGYTFLLAGLVEAQLANWKGAEPHLRRAVAEVPDRVEGWLTLGNALHALGRMEEAAAAYRSATERAPGNAQAWNNLAVVNEDMGRVRDALDDYDRALAAEPSFPQALRGRAAVLAQLRWFEQARQAYEDLLRRYPGDKTLPLEYAELLEQANRPEEASRHLPKPGTLANRHAEARAAYLRAQLMMREGELEPALAALAEARHATGEEFLGYREGMILDRLGRYAEAMAAFERANHARAGQSDFQRLLAQPVEGYLDHKLKTGIEQPGSVFADGGMPRPVFITGLPRSGTTLLDRMLFAHPGVQVLEELEGLRMAEGALAQGADAPEARRVYWEFIERHVTLDRTRAIIDKNPLHVMHLDVVPKLFPGARVILVLRHPFDAALSCYMQDFNPGPVTVRFTALNSTAATCARFLKLMRQYESALPDDVTRVHYEALVTGFQQEVSRVLAAMGLDWHPDIENYAGIAARAAPIMTASYEQVTRRLYNSSVARWKHYETWLGPFHDALDELLPAFGYEAE